MFPRRAQKDTKTRDDDDSPRLYFIVQGQFQKVEEIHITHAQKNPRSRFGLGWMQRFSLEGRKPKKQVGTRIPHALHGDPVENKRRNFSETCSSLKWYP